MKAWIKIFLVIFGTFGAYMAYYVALALFSINTVIIKNDSDRPITIEIYDLSWTVDATDSAVKRFQSDKGDAQFTIRDAETDAELHGVGYVTSSMDLCHKITINTAGDLGYDFDQKARCHLLNW